MRSASKARARRRLYRRHLRPRRSQPPDPVEAGPNGRLIAFDKDLQAIATAEQITDPRFTIVHDSFATMGAALAARGAARSTASCWTWASRRPRWTTPARGFSFRNDGPLDMRMDTTRGISAAEWLATETGTTTGKGDSRLWGRTVCFSDCKGDCCSPGSRANFKHTTACRNRGKRGQNPGEGQGSGNPHLSGYPDFHQ
jgi:hypothetical protein